MSQGFDDFPNHCKNKEFDARFDHFLCFVRLGTPKSPTGSNTRKGRLKREQLHRLEKVSLKALLKRGSGAPGWAAEDGHQGAAKHMFKLTCRGPGKSILIAMLVHSFFMKM